ncbi:MAG: right-handed parallel beta-helix repeat-containing protein, partial [Actinomycetota bacterium]|nr:right-handed parallel beta-helix repeat-containing protein [Actinomycetota bacterium]
KVTVRFSELDHNGMKDFKGTYGGIKQGATDNDGVLAITDSYVHDNIGVGIWGDRCQQRMVAVRNLVVRNSRDGIRWETNMPPDGCSNTTIRSATIRDNVVLLNGTDPTESGDGGIKIRNSPNADVIFNVTGGNQELGILVVYNGVAGANIGNTIRSNRSSDGIGGCEYAKCSTNQ